MCQLMTIFFSEQYLTYTTNFKLSQWLMKLDEIRQRESNLKEPIRMNY